MPYSNNSSIAPDITRYLGQIPGLHSLGMSELSAMRYLQSVIGADSLEEADVEKVMVELKDQTEFIEAEIAEWENSEVRGEMLRSLDYYKNNTPAKDFKRKYINQDGLLEEDSRLHNARLNHPLMRKIVNQKTNYALSKPFSITTESNLDSSGQKKKGEDAEVVKELITELNNNYFTNEFKRDLKDIGREAVIKGLCWVYVNYNEEGKLQLRSVPAEKVIPFWADEEKKTLDALIYYYTVHKYERSQKTNKLEKREVLKILYFTPKGIFHYERNDDGVVVDPDEPSFFEPHFKVINEEQETIDMAWERIPWIAFRDNKYELPMISLIGNLLDEYDAVTSTIVNILVDIPNSIKVIKNYMGTDPEAFTEFVSKYRTIFIRDDGDAHSLETKFDIKSFEETLNRLRKDIYEGSSTVDTQEASLGNASGVALKFRYADLDTATDDLISEFLTSMDKVIWFILHDIKRRTGNDYSNIQYRILFRKDLIIDEEVAVLNAQRSAGILSERTNLANHPYVENVEEELEYKEEERIKQLEDMMEQMKELQKVDPSLSPPNDLEDKGVTQKNFTNDKYPSRSRTAIDKERNSRTVNQVSRQKSLENKR